MNNKIKISDFAKLNRCSLKTIMYYHKIGLLQEPERSPSGYRLYGSEELSRMRMIRHLKNLGLSLQQIKELLGDKNNHRSLKEALQALHGELLKEKREIEEQISRVEALLNKDDVLLEKDSLESESFNMITEVLGPNQVENYREACPEIFDKQSNIFGIIDDFQWGEDYKGKFKELAEYFKTHPEQHKIALEFGKRLEKLSQMSEDDPEIETLAKESAELIKSMPFLKEMLYNQSGFGKPYEGLYNEMLGSLLSPARMKYKELIQKYLNYRP